MSFLEMTATDYGLELHIVERSYRKYGCTAKFYKDLESWVNYFMHK